MIHDVDLLVTAGPGGVGKTTCAAALGVAAAQAGLRTVVMTVDPARRLADALGLDVSPSEPHRVEGVGRDGGELHALMLDAKQTFDDLVREQAGSDGAADAILGNRIYQAISGSLAGAQEYMAIERLHQLHTSGEWDLVIVDTPPSRHALDLLEAPDRLVSFLGHPVYRALTVSQRAFARLTNAAASAFLWAVRRLAGPQIVEDTLEFFRSMANVESGLRTRAAEAGALLRGDSTRFVVVTSPRAEAIGEAGHLVDGLSTGGFPFGGLVVNMIHPTPPPLSDDQVDQLHAIAEADDGPLADHVAWHHDLTRLAALEREEIDELMGHLDDEHRAVVEVIEIPLRTVDVNDLDDLGDLADELVAS
ncbi:MAG: ArsA-related P-loop ATPase [Actinomycetota bacterium]